MPRMTRSKRPVHFLSVDTYTSQRHNLLDSWLRFRLLIRIRCKVSDRGSAAMTVWDEGGFQALSLLDGLPQSPFLKWLSIVGWLRILFIYVTKNNKIRFVSREKVVFINVLFIVVSSSIGYQTIFTRGRT